MGYNELVYNDGVLKGGYFTGEKLEREEDNDKGSKGTIEFSHE